MSGDPKSSKRRIAEERDRLQTILTAAVECLPFGFWALGADGRYILENAANRALWGEIVGKRPADVDADEQTLSVWLDNNRRAFEGEKVEGDVQYTVKGENRVYHNVVCPIRKGEEILGILGVNIDVTDRNRVEAALRESEERFQAFMNNAPSFAWMKDEHGRHVYRNKSAEERLGWRREDWFEKTDFDLWPRRLAEQLKKHDLAVLASGQAMEVIEEIAGPDGGLRCFWVCKFPFRDASGKRYVGGVGVDITERKRAEEALRESEHRFRTVLENSLDAAYRRDLATDECDYMSPAIEHLTGFTAEEVGGMSMADMLSRLHPDDRPRVSELMAAAEAGETGTGLLEYRFRGKDGAYRWLADRFRILRDAAGRPLYCLGIVRDITERKRAEEALTQAHDELEQRVEQRTTELSAANEQLRLFQKFADAAGQGFGMAGLDGRITYVNPTMSRLLGEARPEDVVGKRVQDYFPEEYSRRRQSEIVPALTQGGFWRGEHSLLPRHGEAMPILQNSFLIRDEKGAPFRVATVFTDIRDRNRAEAMLRQSEEKYRTLVETSPDGVIMCDLEGRVTFASAHILQVYGADSATEVLGRSATEFVAEEDREKLLANLRNIVDEGVMRNIEYSLLRKDGTRLAVEISSAVTRDPAGKPNSLVSIVRDITKRKRGQEALERQRRTLERLFQSSDHERRLTAYEIHDGLAQFLAGAIMQFDASVHFKETAPKDAAKAFEAGMMMLRQSHAEARRLISGGQPPILDEEGIVAAVAHLIHERRGLGGPKIEFHSLVEFDRLVSIQESTIYRIVQEGLTNACKHSQSKRVHVELVQQGDTVRIVVQDWGMGFDPAEIGEHCYGLEGIRERARLLGGQCMLETALGEGTRLFVELPLVVREDDAEG